MKTKLKFGSLKIPLCLENNDVNLIAIFTQIMEISMKTDEAAAIP